MKLFRSLSATFGGKLEGVLTLQRNFQPISSPKYPVAPRYYGFSAYYLSCLHSHDGPSPEIKLHSYLGIVGIGQLGEGTSVQTCEGCGAPME